MKKNFMYAVVGVMLFFVLDVHCFGNKTIFGIRSQGMDGALELAGWQQNIYKYDQNSNYGTVAVAAKYSRSIRSDQISNFLFGAEKIRLSGSRAERKQGDILADYFGLPADFSSTVSFSPHISNTIIDFDWFQAFDAYLPGLFFMLHMPVVHTKWDLYMCERGINPGTAFYPAGYMSSTNIPAINLPQSFTQAMRGNSIYGDMDQPLQYGKIFGRQTRSRIAELQASLGWNYNQPWYHAGLSLRVGAPTGNATTAEYLFESIVGNRHHWDLGVGLSGHINVWGNAQEGRRLALYLDAHVSHLFTSQQKRSFDFINGNGSRYMLMEQIESPAENILINGNMPTNQYIGNLVNAINYTTFDTDISIGVQADIVFKLAYQRDGFEFDLGYNFWANSKEKLHCRERFVSDRFALKGDAQVYGFTVVGDIPVAVNATQSMATILAGQGSGNGNFANSNADNQPALASTSTPAAILNQLNGTDATALNITRVQINGSSPAILLTDNDINVESGLLPRAMSHKIFGYAGCVWDNRDDFDPYLGVGASGEFANTNPCNNATCSQWAVWVRGGIAY